MYSVDTMEEAETLLSASCPRNQDGDFVAEELIEEQTLPNLYSFGDRLHEKWKELNE